MAAAFMFLYVLDGVAGDAPPGPAGRSAATRRIIRL